MKLLTIKQASEWASQYLNKQVSESNISYLIQYGKIKKHKDNGSTSVDIDDLKNYYQSYNGFREIAWKEKLGADLNWTLSFDNFRESDTTKHVHRLHPYKGKFIPQLVEYFLDNHIDDFKKTTFFKPGDIVLDPFAGSGTTLVQANELGIYSIGIDISRFNSLITEVKLIDYDFTLLKEEIEKIKKSIFDFEANNKIFSFEKELNQKIFEINNKYFPIKKSENDNLGKIKEKEILSFYDNLIKKYDIKLSQEKNKTFLDKWYINNVREEIDFAFNEIKKIKDKSIKKILKYIYEKIKEVATKKMLV
ncbi:hypothetical protein COW98_03675 [Candidatus Roizmanbacteria bacterium CG22_combo_CG10-13_8_21_14_all_35_9]|uniref:DNA methylase N-4/N-6 domain-containing protein n=3 Tax=Candidatus Roizmaniibacteriota TaxID=1752723 RepID=A0A2M8F416_9BACT|nr:MAG: hypothetical protein COW98_03675 [Candidatus Roizmanbacteria bacterium CG22_combo_CG10-13_8_21_14_all_35_9]PIY71221.1 MAG: hypothetical protein COY88_01485 [Candidatus Roizmanbacteria bacterium CG_4_10_14_0_8_um_filter_35_28]PJC34053.1 MAG: hypothetical protein CO048_01430 [Candidatus Roizmanbacteria bacterium CG_4_9_14_0_2_um_filter_35_15]